MKAKLETKEEIEMYFKIIKKNRIKESIFCYWCTIFEEEMEKAKENKNLKNSENKVVISELNNKRFQKRMFLNLEKSNSSILEEGTEINFLDILDYIKESPNTQESFYKMRKYFDEEENDILLVGIKVKKGKSKDK